MHQWRKRNLVRSLVLTRSWASPQRMISTARTSRWCVGSCWHLVRVRYRHRYSRRLPHWWTTWTSAVAPAAWHATVRGCLPPTSSKPLHCQQLSPSASWTVRSRHLCSTVFRCCRCGPTSAHIQGPTRGIPWSTPVSMPDWTVYRVQTMVHQQANVIQSCEQSCVWYTCYNCHLSKVRHACTWIGTVSCSPEHSRRWGRKICFMDACAVMVMM